MIVGRCPHCDNPQTDETLEGRVTALVRRLEVIAGAVAENPKRMGAFLACANQLTRTYELLGRLTRELTPQTTVTVELGLLERLGVRSLPEAKRAVEQVRELEGLDEHETAALMAQALARYREHWPERWGEIAVALAQPALDVANADEPCENP
jgi:hypothetical protein